MELGESWGRVSGRMEGPEMGRNSTGKPIESINLDHYGKPPTKEHTMAGPRPFCTYVVDVQLGLHLDPSTTGAGTYPDSVPACVDPVPLSRLPHLASVRQDMPSSAMT